MKSDKKPKLTIITINYNNNDGLEKTISSVVNQSWKEFEYIIIDGGSTDDSVATIKKNEQHIDYWVSEKDSGIYDALNKGISVANGKYINFMNSGDFYYTNSILQEIHHKFNENFGVLYGNSFYFNEKGYSHFENTPHKLSFTHFWNSGINHQSSFIRTDLFNKYFVYDLSYKICSDWAFFLWVICKHNESYEHLQKIICNYDFSGISAIPENLDTYNLEREIILKKYFPLFYDDFSINSNVIDRRIKKVLRIKNNLFLWMILKFWINIFIFFLPKKVGNSIES